MEKEWNGGELNGTEGRGRERDGTERKAEEEAIELSVVLLTIWTRFPSLSQWIVGGGDAPASHSIVMLEPSAAENSFGGKRRNLT